ncbi:MAG: glutamine-hydrolyzing GMP synthase [Bacteroidia bacterium]|nr:MAG: glutamine-hydrolyzing GMP synthase [Bacteroidia bacterium]
MHEDKILILDFGSQVTQLIARRIRELHVYCEIVPYDIDVEFILKFKPRGIIFSGGPNSAYENDTPIAPQVIFFLNIPILGICYGMQTMATELGGKVEYATKREFGHARIFDTSSPLFANMKDADNSSSEHREYHEVWMSHGDKVTVLPDGFITIAKSNSCPIAAMADLTRNFYGVQFHPEVTHTKCGIAIIKNFILNICKCQTSWTMPNFIQESTNNIKTQVGNDKVILALSGGVDSTVAAKLIGNAIGDNLICIFVDNGLLRLGEDEQIMQTYTSELKLNVIKIDAKDEFYNNLTNITDPEQKRKIIGRLFVEIFQKEAKKIDGAKWLAQGTIYPDVIESAGNIHKKGHNIKSHHNVGGLPESLHLKLLEPLRELFKDEVRKVGSELGLPPYLVYRHPFPGPGLAVRIMGSITPEYIRLLRLADAIFIEELHNNNYYDKVSQAFVVFLPIKSVGVMGDNRTYDYVVSLRAVETLDFMTANVASLPLNFITHVANRIINEVKGINRVVYDVSGKPPSTIEWE